MKSRNWVRSSEEWRNKSDPDRKKETMKSCAAERLFRVGPSTVSGAGRGVFAHVRIAKGQRLLVTGFLVRRGSDADRCTHYADPYKFRLGADLLIPNGVAAFINHSVTPNVAKVIRGRKIFMEALQEIPAGEELFHCYSASALSRFRHRLNGNDV